MIDRVEVAADLAFIRRHLIMLASSTSVGSDEDWREAIDAILNLEVFASDTQE